MIRIRSYWPLAGALVWAFSLTMNVQADIPAEVESDEPVRTETDLFHPPTRLGAEDGTIDSGPSWGHSSPWVEDVDGDGVRDLVVGDFSGYFRFYRNVGTNEEPRYARAVNLQAGGEDAKVPIY